MLRRDFMKFSLASISAAFCGKVSDASTPKAGSKPNLLIITVDDMNFDSPGCFGGCVKDLTPNIDTLASGGVRFKNAHIACAVCTPSRQAILTGQYPHKNGAKGFTDLYDNVPTLGAILKKDGYYNACICKVVGSVESHRWDFTEHYSNVGYGRNPEIYYNVVTDQIKTAKSRNKPFFIMANSLDPHRPFHGSEQESFDGTYNKLKDQIAIPSKVYNEDDIEVPGFLPDLPDIRKEMAQYYSSCRRADDTVGMILKAVSDSGTMDNTMIVFLSDHGMAVPFAKSNAYVNSTKTCMIVSWKDKVKAGSLVDNNIISAIDIAPTILDAFGYKMPAVMDGSSFWSLLQGEEADRFDFVCTEYHTATDNTFYPMRCIQDSNYAYIFNGWCYPGSSFGGGDAGSGLTLKAMEEAAVTNSTIAKRVNFYLNRTVEELYDIQNDPDCLENLAGKSEYQSKLSNYRSKLEKWMVKTGDDLIDVYRNKTNTDMMKSYCLSQTLENRGRGSKRSMADPQWDKDFVSLKQGIENGISLVQAFDGPSAIEDYEGYQCAVSKSESDNMPSFVYMRVNDNFTFKTKENLKFEFTYFDMPDCRYSIQYNSYYSSYDDAGFINTNGTGKWITKTFVFKDAYFDSTMNFGADIRIGLNAGDRIAVEGFYLTKIY
ncbi:MAG: sulfatase [Sedimentisphaeraceae bacterium JB056]